MNSLLFKLISDQYHRFYSGFKCKSRTS